MSTTGTPPPAPLQPGTRVGRYEILRPLQSGGMGQLYIARSSNAEGFEKLVALKRIVAANDDARESLARALLDEAQLMAALHHPNIAQVYDAGKHDDGAFYAMEYVNGLSLREIVSTLAKRGRGMNLGHALWIAQCAAAALHYAHDKRAADGSRLGIVHRDVCPSNIMITLDGTVKLIDFGIAKSLARKAHTTPGTIKGNLRYMSPEQYLGMPLDARSDIFSLGIVLFELTTGTRWLRERDDLLAAQQMLHGQYPNPSERRAGYAPELEAITKQALARDRTQRQSDAKQLQRQLHEFARSHQLDNSELAMAALMRELFPEAIDSSTQQDLARAAASQATALMGGRDGPPASTGTLRLARNAQRLPVTPPPWAPAPSVAAGAGLTQPLRTDDAGTPREEPPPSEGEREQPPRWGVWVALAAMLAVTLLVLTMLR